MEEEKFKRCNECDGTMSLNTTWCTFCKSSNLKVSKLIAYNYNIKLKI